MNFAEIEVFGEVSHSCSNTALAPISESITFTDKIAYGTLTSSESILPVQDYFTNSDSANCSITYSIVNKNDDGEYDGEALTIVNEKVNFDETKYTGGTLEYRLRARSTAAQKSYVNIDVIYNN